jgi:superfamily II DNA/RNA helicase
MEKHPDLSHDVATDGANMEGADRQAEEQWLSKGVSILLATPGRLLAHLQV